MQHHWLLPGPQVCLRPPDEYQDAVVVSPQRLPVVLFERQWFRLASQEWSPYRVPNAVLQKPGDDSPAALAASRDEIVTAVSALL